GSRTHPADHRLSVAGELHHLPREASALRRAVGTRHPGARRLCVSAAGELPPRLHRIEGTERPLPGGIAVMRVASVTRATKETNVAVTANLDGDGNNARIETPVGFLSHMLDVIARHGRVDLDVVASGDVHIASHHTLAAAG